MLRRLWNTDGLWVSRNLCAIPHSDGIRLWTLEKMRVPLSGSEGESSMTDRKLIHGLTNRDRICKLLPLPLPLTIRNGQKNHERKVIVYEK